MKDETIVIGNTIPPIAAEAIGLFSWDMVANKFCGDAEVARLLGLKPAEMVAGPSIELVLSRLRADDRKRAAKSLHATITGGSLFRDLYHVNLGRGRYRRVLAVARCFGNRDGLPTICSGFFCAVEERDPAMMPTARHQGNVVPFKATPSRQRDSSRLR